MKFTNKIISTICAFSMIASMLAVTTVNAETDTVPKLSTVVESVSDTAIKLNFVVSGVTEVDGYTIKVSYNNAITKDKDAGKDISFSSLIASPVTNTKMASNGGFSILASTISAVPVPENNVIASATLNLEAPLSAPVAFTITEGAVGEKSTDTATLTATGATAYPTVEITNITAAGAVYTGEAVELTASVEPTKLGDRTISWTATNASVTPDETDSTKATLTAIADGAVTVTATVDNNGTPASKTVNFTAEAKPVPMPYTITATTINADGETTITVAPNAEYVYEGDASAPAYKLVVQFYSEGREANLWFSEDCEALTSGTKVINVGAQNAKTVSVTAYADETVVGQN